LSAVASARKLAACGHGFEIMRKPIVVPDLEAKRLVLSVWYVKPGEDVYPGDRIVELLLGSATFDVTSDDNGVFVEQCAWPNDELMPKQVLGYLEASGD
jgi:pyruvate/2-oxoglutarate dehydrogenase complex dihydrolipoamide acyltransferase (E2) component